jgi:hypothetical protein
MLPSHRALAQPLWDADGQRDKTSPHCGAMIPGRRPHSILEFHVYALKNDAVRRVSSQRAFKSASPKRSSQTCPQILWMTLHRPDRHRRSAGLPRHSYAPYGARGRHPGTRQ